MKRQAIYKYTVSVEGPGDEIIAVPKGAQFLSVRGTQQLYSTGKIQISIWALVNPDAPAGSTVVQIRWTGAVEPEPLGLHIGTLVCARNLVWHVFVSQGENSP